MQQFELFPYNRDLETQHSHKHEYGCKITVMEYFRYDHTTVVSYHQPLGLWAGVNSKNNTSYNLDTVNILLTVCRYCQKILLITEIFQSILHSQICNCIFLYEVIPGLYCSWFDFKKIPIPNECPLFSSWPWDQAATHMPSVRAMEIWG